MDIKKAEKMATITAKFIGEMIEAGAGTHEFACVIASICDVYHEVSKKDPSRLLIMADDLLIGQRGGVKQGEKN